MRLGLFIDGPLTGEVMEIPLVPVWRHLLPPRFTECTCDPEARALVKNAEAEIVTYHVILSGVQGRAAILSIHQDETKLFDSLKAWMASDFAAERWERHCRSRRAFT